MQLRRTSKVVRMGIGAAKLCTEAAGIEQPDALSVGTAMGCLQDTEVFLGKMVSQDEKMLTPTAFIQSTHNTVGGQIALLMGCHGHNMTFVHRGHSFEHAVINTRLYLQDHPGQTVLTGGIDELTNSSHLLMQRVGLYRPEEGNAHGVTAGEGAAFFAMNEQAAGALLKIVSLHLFTTPHGDAAVNEVAQFLSSQQIAPQEIEQVVTGRNEEKESQSFYAGIRSMFPDAAMTGFKHLCGEYATASAFALANLTKELSNSIEETNQPAPYTKNVLLVNHYCDQYSCWLLQA